MYLHYAVFLPVDWHSSTQKEKRDSMRHFGLALVLACVLSGTVSAGEIPTTGATSPQPSSSVVTAGEIHTTDAVAIASEIPGTGATAPQDSTAILTLILSLLSIVR